MFNNNINNLNIDYVKNIKPINNEYKNILNPYDLYETLIHIYSIDTCAPRMRDKWSIDNPTVGQCSITSFLAQDIFGGEVYGVKLSDGNYHCFNVIDGYMFDLTSEQFGCEKLDYTLDYKQDRNIHFLKKEKEDRYHLLSNKLIEYLNK